MSREDSAREGTAGSGAISVDTRHDGSLRGRVYAASFADVWDALLTEVSGHRSWTLVHSDEDLGLLTAVCRRVLPRETGHLTVWVRLDENALTRVDVRSMSRSAIGRAGGDRRRVEALMSRLDRRLGGSARIRT